MSIFTAVPGGTFLGNLIRSGASTLTGGIAGQGANKINADGSVGNGTKSTFISDFLASAGYVVSQTPEGQKIIKDSAITYTSATAKNNWIWLAIVAVLGVLLIVVTVKK